MEGVDVRALEKFTYLVKFQKKNSFIKAYRKKSVVDNKKSKN